MAQFQQFSVVRTNKTFTIQARVLNDAGVQVADFTGANALVFPSVMATLTDAQVDALAQVVANWLVLTKAGLIA